MAELTIEQAQKEFDALVQYEVIDYVLPALEDGAPVGTFVLGYTGLDGQPALVKLNGMNEVGAFLAGYSLTAKWAARRAGVMPR